MLIGAVADDLTGASDLANSLARTGMRTLQSVGLPKGAAPDCDALVVGLKTRSIQPRNAVFQSLEACAWLRAQGARQILFKYCSTFDSTKEGNIGPVAKALMEATGSPYTIFCPAFPANRRTIFQGHLFVGDRLLSESGMQNHPLTPMTDPDLRRWLGYQSDVPVGLADLSEVRKGAASLRAAFARLAAAGQRFIVVDAVSDDDLLVIGEACAGLPLVTGGSGVALGLPANFRREGALASAPAAMEAVTGPGVVMSGSCSTASRGQVEIYRADHPAFRLDPQEIAEGRVDAEALANEIWAAIDRAPIVYTTDDPDAVSAVQARLGRERVAGAIEHLFGRLALALAERGVRRFVVGGGETSGAVTQALGLALLEIGPEIDPGVPALLCRDRGETIGLALKSGNFGAPDFYAKAMKALAGQGRA